VFEAHSLVAANSRSRYDPAVSFRKDRRRNLLEERRAFRESSESIAACFGLQLKASVVLP